MTGVVHGVSAGVGVARIKVADFLRLNGIGEA